jgi:hypothetical protein
LTRDGRRALAIGLGAFVVLAPGAFFGLPAGRNIYVGAERHDTATARGSRPIFYFVCGRLPAVRAHALEAGVTDREDVQADRIGWIAGNQARCVLLERTPEAASVRPGILDRWLAENASPVQETPELRILWIRE